MNKKSNREEIKENNNIYMKKLTLLNIIVQHLFDL